MKLKNSSLLLLTLFFLFSYFPAHATTIATGIFDQHVSIIRFWENTDGKFTQKWIVANSDTKPHTIEVEGPYDPYSINQQKLQLLSTQWTIPAENYIIVKAPKEVAGLISIKKDSTGIGLIISAIPRPTDMQNKAKIILTEGSYNSSLSDSWIELQSITASAETIVTARIYFKIVLLKDKFPDNKCERGVDIYKSQKYTALIPTKIETGDLKRKEFPEWTRINIPWRENEPNKEFDFIDVTFTIPSVTKPQITRLSYNDINCMKFLESTQETMVLTSSIGSISIVTTPK